MSPINPFPYQGSKRKLAPTIIKYFPGKVNSLIEPFCGAAAVSIYAAYKKRADKFIINDLNKSNGPGIDRTNQRDLDEIALSDKIIFNCL